VEEQHLLRGRGEVRRTVLGDGHGAESEHQRLQRLCHPCRARFTGNA
jgi:hypothetical protein